MTKCEEKAEALNAFFGSVFKIKTSSPELWNTEWSEASMIQGEALMTSTSVRHTQGHRARWDPPKEFH